MANKCVFGKSLWDPRRDGLTVSMLSSYMEDREATRLKYVEGWTPNQTPLPIDFGVCGHYVLEHFYGRTRAFDPLNASKPVDKALRDFHKTWLEEQRLASTRNLEQHESIMALMHPLATRYLQRYAGDFGGTYKESYRLVRPVRWIALEGEFRVPLKLPSGEELFLRGKRDGVFTDRREKTWLFETKFKGMIEEDNLSFLLPKNFQVLFYLLSLWKETGKVPEGVLYNVVRRPTHRRRTDEVLRNFVERVAKDINDRSRTDHWFVRWEVGIAKAELQQFEQAVLAPLLQDVLNWWDGKSPHYPSYNALETKYGLADMARLIVNRDQTGYHRRTRVFNELGDLYAA